MKNITKLRKRQKGITLIALVITIVVLLILAGITIASITKDNGIIKEANSAKKSVEMQALEEQIEMAIIKVEQENRNPTLDQVIEEIKKIEHVTGVDRQTGAIKNDLGEDIIGKLDDYIKKQNTEEDIPNIKTPEGWEIAEQNDWYNYGDATIEEPKLVGGMKCIKYVGETQTGNKWANAITADESMWVWIPRYAYKITTGYHSNIAGTIEVAFINTDNKFLNGETGDITEDPSVEGAGITKWLVHPSFTANATNGGGFGEIEGLWVGKFETTGTRESLSVKPGNQSLMNMTINEQYKLAKTSTFGEKVNLRSHMAKNSEWGATVYLGHSKYGTNGTQIQQNKSSYTGGSEEQASIYAINKTQSSTGNATGVYDLNGGSWEYMASYTNEEASNLSSFGGTEKGDLYGATAEERTTSTAYKMVYEGTGSQSTNYETAKKYKGDSVYETSNGHRSGDAWFSTISAFQYAEYPFSVRSGDSSVATSVSSFCFWANTGNSFSNISFRLILVP